jgi:IS5 family transposase
MDHAANSLSPYSPSIYACTLWTSAPLARKPENMKKHIKAQKKLHRIAFKIYQDLVNQLNPIPKTYMSEFDVLYRVLKQQKDDKNKVYSIHEPEVLCISKGKEHKQYEFGNKSSFAYNRGSGIIVGAMAIDGNAYDGHTLEQQLEQVNIQRWKI